MQNLTSIILLFLSLTWVSSFTSELDFEAAFKRLTEGYHVEVEWKSGSHNITTSDRFITAKNASDWELQAYAPILLSEFNLYPASFVQKSQLKRIVICRDLWVESQGINQNVSATPYDKDLFFCVSYTYKVNNRDKQRRVIHHAFFHMVDSAHGLIEKDKEWEKLNPEGFYYGMHGRGGHSDRTSKAGLLTAKYPGFLNKYSTGYLADDKADIFAYMMVLYHYVEKCADQDAIIKAKMQLMKTRLKQLSPEMDANFWNRIKEIKRDIRPYITLD